METKNIFNSIPDNLDNEVIESLVHNEKIKLQRIISKGHVSPASGWYDQDSAEWVLVLKGAATIDFELGETLKLEVGDYVNIPAHAKHKVTWTDDNSETIWLTMHY